MGQTLRPRPARAVAAAAAALIAVATLAGTAAGANLGEAEALYRAGKYEACRAVAAEAVEDGVWNVRWPMLLIRCQLTTGRYEEALQTYEAAAEKFTFNALPLRVQGVQVYRMNDQTERAEQEMVRIRSLIRRSIGRFMSKDSMIAIGRFLLTQDEDARKILELFFDKAIEADPTFVDAHIASAELALAKNDFQLAAETLDRAVRLQQDEPYLYYLQARAWLTSDRARSEQALQRALEVNPRHPPSLLLKAEQLIDGERYEQAREVLADVFRVNALEPRAWALLAVIAHLEGDPELEAFLRSVALSTWSTNPEVDHWIGEKLSQKYRFAEGAAYQRRALALRPDSTEYRFQLAQDLLRLGEEQVGWELVQQTQQDDPYNVVAYNLMILHDALQDYRILESDGILLRMQRREAELYGQQAMELLREAKGVLCEKYAVQPDKQIIVEIYPRQQDFAIRTFGLPGGQGYLGVCFGRVITANSPASQGASPANWKSVLWHEFCHVVTLEKTRNRMPRWLSEGISVYEERQRDPSWGQRMSPLYREMILRDSGRELTPVSRLSDAFLRPESSLHLDFAYYESSLVVEYFVERFGRDALNRLLDDLGIGMSINEALGRHSGSVAELDEDFAAYATARAEAFGADADWQRPPPSGSSTSPDAADVLASSPKNYWALKDAAAAAVASRDWSQADALLDRLDALLAEDASDGCATELRARAAAARGRTDAERKHLLWLAERRDDDLATYDRAATLAAQQEQWTQVRELAQQILAVNPLVPAGHRHLAAAGEATDRPEDTAEALAALALLDPVDPAGLHYRWARALAELDRPRAAKRKVLIALEYAPRYQQALRLLLSLTQEDRP
ncbi:tetratricopeptide repeat protein [Roseimaritima sediminicola]|uniref:tetratricopeptide repeat protein n=1 Tax=Roseimaritima sediminicola TaxID=2662066 RepID=UPI001F40B716|nr:tetratricopeptide repeat protein [Roseimaritima sediminicola]